MVELDTEVRIGRRGYSVFHKAITRWIIHDLRIHVCMCTYTSNGNLEAMRIVAKGTCLLLHAQLNLLCNCQNFPVVYHTCANPLIFTFKFLFAQQSECFGLLKGLINITD